MKKSVFITGASQGIGLELSRYFSEKGYFVYAGSFKEEAPLFGPGKILWGDVSKEDDVKKMFAEIDELDVLINNARFDPSFRQQGVTDGEWWDMNMDVSLKGTFLCSLSAISLMKPRGGGVIVNMSSIRGIVPNDWLRIPYGAAKAGQISLTRSFAKELGADNIRVNAILPGAVMTENLKKRVDVERLKAVNDTIPLNRFGSMEEICHAVFFLVENSYMTGACLNCSGGLLIDA